MSAAGLSLSVVMPCLNEESNAADAVRATLGAFDSAGISGEIIVVDDGSSDRTRAIAEELVLRDRRVRLIHHETPKGIGSSFWDGVLASSMSCVTLIPGDNENEPREAMTYLPLCRHVDIVVPFVCNAEVRSKMRRIISSVYRFIVNFSFGTNLNYTNGTVIYNTDVLKEITLYSKGFFYQTELLIRLIRSGYLYAEVPYFLKERRMGITKALSLKSLRVVMAGYFKLMWDVHIIRKFGQMNQRLNPVSATYRRIHSVER